MLRIPILIVLLFSVGLSAGCQTDEEKAHDAVMNFVMADWVHAAPYRSYLFISDADQAAMTAEEYASWHDRAQLPGDSKVGIDALNLDQNSGSADVNLDGETSSLTLVREENRWRVHLGLSEALAIGELLQSAEGALKKGELERSLELIDKAEGMPVRGTLGPALDERTSELKARVEKNQRDRRIEALIEASREADLDTLRKHLSELESFQLKRLDEELSTLRTRLTQLRRDRALENLALGESKVRRFYAGRNIVFEGDLTLTNASEVPIKSVTLNLTMLQRGESLGTRAIPLVFEPELKDGEPQTMTVAIPDGPVAWRSREFDHTFSDLEIVDE